MARMIIFKKRDVKKRENILLYGFSKVDELLKKVRKREYRSARRMIRRGMMVERGFSWFAVNVGLRYRDLVEQVKKSGKKVSLQKFEVYINELVRLLDSSRGEIFCLLRAAKTPDRDKLIEKLKEAKKTIKAAIAEEKKILKEI